MTNKEAIDSAVAAMMSGNKAEMRTAGIRIGTLLEQEVDWKREDFEGVHEELLSSFAGGMLYTLSSIISD